MFHNLIKHVIFNLKKKWCVKLFLFKNKTLNNIFLNFSRNHFNRIKTSFFFCLFADHCVCIFEYCSLQRFFKALIRIPLTSGHTNLIETKLVYKYIVTQIIFISINVKKYLYMVCTHSGYFGLLNKVFDFFWKYFENFRNFLKISG